MFKVLVTGATGNVGTEVIRALFSRHLPFEVYAGVRQPAVRNAALDAIATAYHGNLYYTAFDFEQPALCEAALHHADFLFLLRPPALADVPKYFAPIIAAAVRGNIKHIVFLSVQGADKSTIIPHAKIEREIIESGIAYTFLRPAYFMQNFTTFLLPDLLEQHRIYLPAGKARFTLIDLVDVGDAAAAVLADPHLHLHKAYDLTAPRALSFGEMAAILSTRLPHPIRYISPNLLTFFLTERRAKTPLAFIAVKILLHYLPRFQATPLVSDSIEILTGKPANTFEEFVEANAAKLSAKS